MSKKKFTYKTSGVDINTTSRLVKYISNLSNKTKIKGSTIKSFKNIGGFGSLFDLSQYKIKNPVLVSATDGVGTKLELANITKKYDTIGIDLVAMCVNDLIVQGAKPLFFLDYIAIGKVVPSKYKSILKGIAKGCEISKCYLAGGETAEMPGIYSKDGFDLAGFSVGVTDKKRILNSQQIKKGDAILAIPSSGVHSNGFSLVRKILKEKKILYSAKNKKLYQNLLTPTKIYTKEIQKLFEQNLIHGACNITGGGLTENIPRVLPKNVSAKINLAKVKVKKIFSWISKQGVDQGEMLKTFNCGVGFVVFAKTNNIAKITKVFKSPYKPYAIGTVTGPSSSNIIFDGNLKF
ncbi:MAG: phosphoribosylformylglycinamidine cyclo-ligase [Candidatus Pelagibacter sp.]|nr:phosphoribosylformylglycinamidine cyclo-ligase [Candidatus Pelagibacter sp.]